MAGWSFMDGRRGLGPRAKARSFEPDDRVDAGTIRSVYTDAMARTGP